MIYDGGIIVKQGEIRRDQPFRVGIMDADGYDHEFWTNEPDDAARVFTICVERHRRRK